MANKYIKDLGLPHNHLIIMIQREGNEIIVPVGDTLLLEGDKIIMIKAEHPLNFLWLMRWQHRQNNK